MGEEGEGNEEEVDDGMDLGINSNAYSSSVWHQIMIWLVLCQELLTTNL